MLLLIDKFDYLWYYLAILASRRRVENPEGFRSKLKVWVNILERGRVGCSINKSDHESSLTKLCFAFYWLSCLWQLLFVLWNIYWINELFAHVF